MTSNQRSRQFRIEIVLGRRVLNPLVRAINRAGLGGDYTTELATTGRRSGERRVVPVVAKFDGDGAWIVSQHGARSGWAHNIEDDPRVQVKRRSQWVSGTAEFRRDDDPGARAADFARYRWMRPIARATFRALQTHPISVRITFAHP